MAITLTKLSDGDLSLGNLRAELVNASFGSSDYITGGYLIQGIGGTTESTGNVGMDKVLFIDPVGGGFSGSGVAQTYSVQWNSSTSKLQVFEPSGNGAMVEVSQTTQLLNYTFELLIGGL